MENKKRFGGVKDWIDNRTGLFAYWKKVGETPVSGGSKWHKSFTAVLILFILVQFVTGMALLLKYSPTPDTAYSSVIHIQDGAPLGSLIRGLHHWGVSVLMLLLGIQLLSTFLLGGYKTPREISYWSLLIIVVLLMGMAFTGHALSWDQKGYWGSVVVISSLEHAPLIGAQMASFLRGGPAFGASTLTTLSALHTSILPALLVLTMLVHWISFRRKGPVAGWTGSDSKGTESYSPGQFFKDAVVFFVIFIALFGVALFAPPALDSPADTLNPPTSIKPEWYFLWLYYGVRFAGGDLAVIAEIIAPLLLLIYFFFLPFLDRGEDRNPAKRWKFLVIPALVFISIAALTVAALLEGPGDNEQTIDSQPAVVLSDAEREWARETFSSTCSGCHGATGLGDGSLLEYREDLREHLPVFDRNFFAREEDEELIEAVVEGKPKGAEPPLMPAFGDRFSKEEIGRLIVYLRNEYGDRDVTETEDWGTLDDEAFRWASETFQTRCISCHGESGKGDGSVLEFRPELKEHIPVFEQEFFEHESPSELEESVADGIPAGSEFPRMPAFGNDLSSEEIQKLIAFLYAKFGKN